MEKSVLCLARDEVKAVRILDDLLAAGISNERISVLIPERAVAGGFASGTNSVETPGTRPGAWNVLGGALDRFVETGIWTRPRLGRFVCAGPLLAALNASPMGIRARGIAGALMRSDVTPDQAEHYESRLGEGKILISIRSHSAEESGRVEMILGRAGGDEIVIAEPRSANATHGSL